MIGIFEHIGGGLRIGVWRARLVWSDARLREFAACQISGFGVGHGVSLLACFLTAMFRRRRAKQHLSQMLLALPLDLGGALLH